MESKKKKKNAGYLKLLDYSNRIRFDRRDSDTLQPFEFLQNPLSGIP